MTMKPSEFGFLIKPLKGSFLGVTFAPLIDYAESLEAIKKTLTEMAFTILHKLLATQLIFLLATLKIR